MERAGWSAMPRDLIGQTLQGSYRVERLIG